MNESFGNAPVKPKQTAIVAQASQMDCQLLASAIERQCRIRVLACFVHSSDLIEAVHEQHPDFVVIGVRLQDGPYAGLKAAKSLHFSAVSPKIVMLLDCDDRELVVESFRCGAKGVFTRDQSSTELCKCISAILQGQTWATNAQFGYVVEAFARTPAPSSLPYLGARALTKREEEVLKLVAAGLSNKEVAERLKINQTTVKNYVSGIFEKLGVSSRVELVLHFFSEQARRPQLEAHQEPSKQFGT